MPTKPSKKQPKSKTKTPEQTNPPNHLQVLSLDADDAFTPISSARSGKSTTHFEVITPTSVHNSFNPEFEEGKNSDKFQDCPYCNAPRNVLTNRRSHCKVCGIYACHRCVKLEGEFGGHKNLKVCRKCKADYDELMRETCYNHDHDGGTSQEGAAAASPSSSFMSSRSQLSLTPQNKGDLGSSTPTDMNGSSSIILPRRFTVTPQIVRTQISTSAHNISETRPFERHGRIAENEKTNSPKNSRRRSRSSSKLAVSPSPFLAASSVSPPRKGGKMMKTQKNKNKQPPPPLSSTHRSLSAGSFCLPVPISPITRKNPATLALDEELALAKEFENIELRVREEALENFEENKEALAEALEDADRRAASLARKVLLKKKEKGFKIKTTAKQALLLQKLPSASSLFHGTITEVPEEESEAEPGEVR